MKNIATNITDLFLEHIWAISNLDLSKTDEKSTKTCLLDYLGVTLAGAKEWSSKKSINTNTLFFETGDRVPIGFHDKTGVLPAAMINGISSHIMELDDGHRCGMIHPGGPAISALISIAEHENLNTQQFLQGILVGYEAAILLACAIQPYHKNRGYHTTGTCGAVGAAMGISTALNATKDEMKNILASSATSAGGLLAVTDDVSELKPYNVGQAAVSAISAYYAGKAGFSGPEDILGGKRGFFNTLAGQWNHSFLEHSTMKKQIETIYVKPYAACRHAHAPIEAVLNIKNKYDVQCIMIDSVNIKTYDLAVEGHDHKKIHNISSAKMSIPYSVAIALYTGRAGIEQFNGEYIKNPSVNALINKIDIDSDKSLSALVPDKRTAIAEIVLRDGQKFKERIDYPKGEPENPLTDEELRIKFVSLACYGGKTEKEAGIISNYIFNEKMDILELLKML